MQIDTREMYDYCISRGIEPMRDRHFTMDFALRKELEKELFGRGNKEENNIRFYRYAWKISKHICSECGKPLERYSSCYISHRWSRGAHPEMAYDLRNFDILCTQCHNKFESPITRKSMRIYNRVNKEMEELRQEYINKF